MRPCVRFDLGLPHGNFAAQSRKEARGGRAASAEEYVSPMSSMAWGHACIVVASLAILLTHRAAEPMSRSRNRPVATERQAVLGGAVAGACRGFDPSSLCLTRARQAPDEHPVDGAAAVGVAQAAPPSEEPRPRLCGCERQQAQGVLQL